MVLMILSKFGSSVRDYLRPKGCSKRKTWLNIGRVILLIVRSLCTYSFVWNIVMKLRRADFKQYMHLFPLGYNQHRAPGVSSQGSGSNRSLGVGVRWVVKVIVWRFKFYKLSVDFFNGSSPLLEIYKIVSFRNGSFDLKFDKGRR